MKPILMKSQLHVNVLGQIWELSDVDKDGQLDIEEFSLAMHLLNKFVYFFFNYVHSKLVYFFFYFLLNRL